MSSPASIPRSLPQTAPIIGLLVELREAAESLSASHTQVGSAIVLAESSTLIESALTAVHRVRESEKPLPQELLLAEAFALRELAAARRHHALASRSPDTCRAACNLALRCLMRAVDTLLTKLIPHTLAPSGF